MMDTNTAVASRPAITTGVQRNTLMIDLRSLSLLISTIQDRHNRGEYAGQKLNLSALLEIQCDASRLGDALMESNR